MRVHYGSVRDYKRILARNAIRLLSPAVQKRMLRRWPVVGHLVPRWVRSTIAGQCVDRAVARRVKNRI